ncbi:MAG TPA: S9 family peptidase [Solirubrobacteraceae bacterium]|jgi:dipeptidyl aminopeptidase/acylaminoacyl peptidase
MAHDTRTILPYGSWSTPVTSKLVVAEAVGLSELRIDGGDVIWSEIRPAEGGRTAIVRLGSDGSREELLEPGQNARTAVHEYGGAAWWAWDGVVWFCAWRNQRLYRRDPGSGVAEPLTPEPEVARGDRYADGDVSIDGTAIVCVRERHPVGGRGAVDVVNEIVQLDATEPSAPKVVVSGPDFVSSPRWSPDARRLCWIEWDHPNMPWDGTRLRVRDLDSGEETLVAGGPEESVSEPRWREDGTLAFISDRTGWWSLYTWSPDAGVAPLIEIEAEIGVPQWVFGSSRYCFLADGRVVFAYTRDGLDHLAVRLPHGEVTDLEVPFSLVRAVRAAGPSDVVVIASTPTEEASVVRLGLGDGSAIAATDVVRPARSLEQLGVPPELISTPEPIDFPSASGRTSHALLYRPTNPGFAGPDGELPPLYVAVHGGPTSAVRPALDIETQYWTSRGFMVVEVNYGGSTGYGREYRDLLRDAWGIVDVEDCIAAARWLAEQGLVDPDRICIAGGSAGGFTTLAALAQGKTPFAAGGDYFGVADLEALATDTHKFESRYLDRLIGPYPERRDLYRERSPIEHVEQFSRPLIVLQGLEDQIVLPNQATMIVDALERKRVPVAYLAFEGEQHGFRQEANVRRALDSELSFYSQVLGFELPAQEGIEPVAIRGL